MLRNNLIPEKGSWENPLSDTSVKVWDSHNESWITIQEAHERYLSK